MQEQTVALMDSNLAVKEIACKVGFDDQFHFSKNFKNMVGISPLQFREQVQQANTSIKTELTQIVFTEREKGTSLK